MRALANEVGIPCRALSRTCADARVRAPDVFHVHNHGRVSLAGIGRLSLRSILATCTFMATGVAASLLSGTAGALGMSAAQGLSMPSKGFYALAAAALAVTTAVPLVAGAIAKGTPSAATKAVISDVADGAFGATFGAGLVLSGMPNPSKVSARSTRSARVHGSDACRSQTPAGLRSVDSECSHPPTPRRSLASFRPSPLTSMRASCSSWVVRSPSSRRPSPSSCETSARGGRAVALPAVARTRSSLARPQATMATSARACWRVRRCLAWVGGSLGLVPGLPLCKLRHRQPRKRDCSGRHLYQGSTSTRQWVVGATQWALAAT